MDLKRPETNHGEPEDILGAAQAHFQRAITALNDMIREMEAGNTDDLRDAKRITLDLRKAMQSALDERTRVENIRKLEAGIVHDFALDFALARDEIGRRLACLRAARDPGEVS